MGVGAVLLVPQHCDGLTEPNRAVLGEPSVVLMLVGQERVDDLHVMRAAVLGQGQLGGHSRSGAATELADYSASLGHGRLLVCVTMHAYNIGNIGLGIMSLNAWRAVVILFVVAVLGHVSIIKELVEIPSFRGLDQTDAAWIQAVGSILAILVAVCVNASQIRYGRKQRQIEVQNKRAAFLAVVEFAADQGQAIAHYLEDLPNLRPFVSMWENKFSSVTKFVLESLAAIPMHELGDRIAVLSYSEIYTNLYSIREDAIILVAEIKEKQTIDRECLSRIYNAANSLKGDLLNFKLYFKVDAFA